jgi:hypothetical protein
LGCVSAWTRVIGTWIPAVCAAGKGDCDVNPDNGCEVTLATDAANCGTCGNSCGGGKCAANLCSAGLLMNPADGDYHYSSAYLVGSNVYELTNYAGWKALKTTLPATNPASAGTVVHSTSTMNGPSTIDSTYVYYFTNAVPPILYRKRLDGTGSPVRVFANASTVYLYTVPYNVLRVTSTDAYFSGYSSSTGKYAIYKGSLSNPSAIPAGISGLTNRGPIYDMLITGSQIFWLEYTSGKYQIFTSSLTSPAPVLLDADVGYHAEVHFATYGSYVYWNRELLSGAIKRVPVANPVMTSVTNVATNVVHPQGGLVVDATYAYFRDNTFRYYRVKNDGSSTPQILSKMNVDPRPYSFFAVDANFIYGIGISSEIVRLAKTP